MSASEIVRLAFLRDPASMSQIDSHLRNRGLPAMAALPGVVDLYAGRRGPDQNGERVVVSVWRADEAGDVPPTDNLEIEMAQLEGTVERLAVVTLPVEIAERFPVESPARVLRVFRGVIRDGMVDRYLAAARTGSVSDSESGEGPMRFYLGMGGNRRFVSVSVWPGWSAIQERTGGNLHRPVATRHREMLESGSAYHYEILPAAEGPTGIGNR